MADTTISDLTPQTFSELGLHADILKAVAATGYTSPTPIQARLKPAQAKQLHLPYLFCIVLCRLQIPVHRRRVTRFGRWF